jgi:hypothetical protein
MTHKSHNPQTYKKFNFFIRKIVGDGEGGSIRPDGEASLDPSVARGPLAACAGERTGKVTARARADGPRTPSARARLHVAGAVPLCSCHQQPGS